MSKQAVQVHVDEAEARRGSPVSQQPGFDVFRPQRLAQQRILLQIDLAALVQSDGDR